MRVMISWFRGNEDGYIEVYEIDDEEFEKALEETSPDNDPDAWRDLAYFVVEKGRLLYMIEPHYTITVYGWG